MSPGKPYTVTIGAFANRVHGLCRTYRTAPDGARTAHTVDLSLSVDEDGMLAYPWMAYSCTAYSADDDAPPFAIEYANDHDDLARLLADRGLPPLTRDTVCVLGVYDGIFRGPLSYRTSLSVSMACADAIDVRDGVETCAPAQSAVPLCFSEVAQRRTPVGDDFDIYAEDGSPRGIQFNPAFPSVPRMRGGVVTRWLRALREFTDDA